MTINEAIKYQKLKYDIKAGATKYQYYHQVKQTKMNISLMKIYYLHNNIE